MVRPSGPTEHFTVLEPQNPEIDELCVDQKRRSTDERARNCKSFGRDCGAEIFYSLELAIPKNNHYA